jgi:hypothetical protein
MNIFSSNKDKSIRVSKKKYNIKLINILLLNKVFNIRVLEKKNNDVKSNIYSLNINLLENSVKKKILIKKEKNMVRLKKRLEKKLCMIKEVSEVLCLHSEILDLQRIEKLGLNL